jgi:hypothetical protein
VDCAIGAASACAACEHTSCKRQAAGSNPATGSQFQADKPRKLVCRPAGLPLNGGPGSPHGVRPETRRHLRARLGIIDTTFSAAARETSAATAA